MARPEGTMITGPRHVTTPGQGIYEESVNQLYELGTMLDLAGRQFRYAKANEALSVGTLLTAVLDSDAEDTVTVAHGIGTVDVTVTAASAITANQYKDGFLIVDEGTGAGYTYRIDSHPAIGSAATGTITLKDPLVVAWAIADTDITLWQSPYVVQESNTDQVECPMGIAPIAVTSAYYFWMQISGFGGTLMDEAFGNNVAERVVTIGSSTAGSVEAQDAQGETIVGDILSDAGDTEDAKYYPVFLRRG